MCTGQGSNQGPFGPKSNALTTAPLRHHQCNAAEPNKGLIFGTYFLSFEKIAEIADLRCFCICKKPFFAMMRLMESKAAGQPDMHTVSGAEKEHI